MKNTFALCAFVASTVSAHMQMSNPYPLRSPLNPNGDESKKDYSYTNPLSASGSDYPCKGYADDTFKSVATYSAGGQYSMSLQGSATHGGGSCQLALSYDTGKTFTVIQSIEGGCPLTSNYTFTVPTDAPSGDALFAWTWFNKIGNREMYMNCAQVTIDGGSSKPSHARDLKVSRGDVAFSSRPPLFIANVNGPGGCTTTSSEEVNFPEPGPDVEGSVDGTGYTCSGTADFLGSGGSSSSSNSSSSSGASSSSSGSSSSSSKSSPSSTSSTSSTPAAAAPSEPPAGPSIKASTVTTTTTITTSSTSSSSSKGRPANTDLPTASGSAPKVVGSDIAGGTQACAINGAIVCGAEGNTWSMCSQGRLTSMGMVASGTVCKNGAITLK